MFPLLLRKAVSHQYLHILTPLLKRLMTSLQGIDLGRCRPLAGSLANHRHHQLSRASKLQNYPDFTSKLPSLSCLNSLRIKVHSVYTLYTDISPSVLITTFCYQRQH